MKKLHISIISIVAIIVVAATSIGIFIGRTNDNPQQPYLTLEVNGIKQNYTVNEPISFSVILQGYGTACGDTNVTITKENDSKFLPLEWTNQPQCVANPQFHNFKFTVLSETTTINRTGNYLLTATFDDLFKHQTSVTQKFSIVISSNQSMAPVVTTPDLNYSITSDNKILGINMTQNINSATIALSLDASNSGTITVAIPKTLDDLIHNKGAQLVVLLDGQEIGNYNETKNGIHYVIIPFKQGTKQIIVSAIVIM